jgi:hypothetical protein
VACFCMVCRPCMRVYAWPSEQHIRLLWQPLRWC